MAEVEEISDALRSSVDKVSEKEKAVAKREAAVEAREAAVRERSEGARAQSRAAAEELRKRAEAAETKVSEFIWHYFFFIPNYSMNIDNACFKSFL